MTTNPYFNNFNSVSEQQLLDDLIVESIQMYGHEVYYCPRSLINEDKLYGTDVISQYNANYPIEMFIKNVDGFAGDGEFLSKFNIEIRFQTTFTLSVTRFKQEVKNQLRPNEGDLIWFPMVQQLYQVKFVNYKPVFYQLGTLYTYDLTCEIFEYSAEPLNTGIPEIDNVQKEYSMNLEDWPLLTDEGNKILMENGYSILLDDFNFNKQDQTLEDNDVINEEAGDIIDFSEENPFGDEVI